MAQQKQRVICIIGPTASGKSAFAVEVARRFGGEIVSADSRQVYRGLNIGAGKITKREMRGVPHHLLDVASAKRVFSANDFKRAGRAAVSDIANRGKAPIICGGSGFYLDALLGNIMLPEVPPNPILRTELKKKSVSEMFTILTGIDPQRAQTIDANNPHRLVRAIEVATALGANPLPVKSNVYNALWVGLLPSKESLYERIAMRLTARLRAGMVAEAKRLHANGLSYKRMDELGLEYRFLARYLRGELSREQLKEELQRAIEHYAKRQMTYWRRNKLIHWFDPTQATNAFPLIETFLRD